MLVQVVLVCMLVLDVRGVEIEAVVYMRVAWVIRWYEWLSECINLVY